VRAAGLGWPMRNCNVYRQNGRVAAADSEMHGLANRLDVERSKMQRFGRCAAREGQPASSLYNDGVFC